MTTEKDVQTEEISETVQKSDDTSVTSILASLVKAQEDRIDSFEKRFDGLETLIKEHNANPVDHGTEVENQPKVEDKDDVGDKVTVGNQLAPSPKDQASIIAPALQTPSADAEGLKMENKADDEEKKEECKKEEVAKTEDEEKDDKKEEVKKSDETSEYEIVKTGRPVLKAQDDDSTIPTGYQILKAIAGGWNGQTSSAEEALVIAHNKLESGEFGNGLPQGAY